MAMQDKLIISYLLRESNETLEIDLNDLKNDDILFEFNETETVSIMLESEIFDVSIECLSCIVDGRYKSVDDNFLKLQPNVTYVISKNDSYDVNYRPSLYHISINDSIKEYDCLFKVETNKQVSSDGLNNIIERINGFISGLTIDFFKNQRINKIFLPNGTSDFEIFEILAKNQSRLSMVCDKIISDLQMNIKGVVQPGFYNQKQNLASIRKNVKSTGEKQYNYKKVLSPENVNNIILKKYLIKIMNLIEKCKVDLDYIVDNKKNSVSLIHDKIGSELINLQKNNSNFNRIIIENHIKSLESEKEELRKLIDKLEKWNTSYCNAVFSIKKLLNSKEIKNIDVNNQVFYSSDYNMNYNYKYIADFYNSLNAGIGNKKGKNKELFSNKKSYALFEVYGFILIQNILKEIGYDFKNSDNSVFDFMSGSEFLFEKESRTVKVKYDYYCEKFNRTQFDSIVNINSKNCKPDYIICFYNNNKLVNVVIVEMKYRNLKYLIDYDGGSTEVDTTLDDYYQLGYSYDLNTRFPEHLVRNVLLIYPSKDEICFERNLSNYIGINPELDFDKSEAYEKIKECLLNNS